MDMSHVRVTVSLLAPGIVVRERGVWKTHYVGILNRQAHRADHRLAWGPIGGAASAAACPTLGRLRNDDGVEFWDDRSQRIKDLRLRVPREHLDAVLRELEAQIPLWGEGDFRRELEEELCGKELRRLDQEPILTEARARRIKVRFLRFVRQPRNGGFVASQRVGEQAPTKRLLFFYELRMSRRTFKAMMRSRLMREFDGADLPGADDPPREPIILDDGTELRGHLIRLEPAAVATP